MNSLKASVSEHIVRSVAIFSLWFSAFGAQAQSLSCADLDGAYIVGQDQTRANLGFFGTPEPVDSIYSRFGAIAFTAAPFGGLDSPLSVDNPLAAYPPIIVRRGQFVAFLTANTALAPAVSLTQINQVCRSTFRATAAAANLGETPPMPPQVGAGVFGVGLSGLWWNPARSGEGVNLDFGGLGSTNFLLFTWYAYDNQGFPIFLVGAIPYTASDLELSFEVGVTTGSPLRQEYDRNLVRRQAVGRVTLRPQSCGQAFMRFDSSVEWLGNMETELERFAAPLPPQFCR